MCNGCRWYVYDNSTGTCDCLKADDMTEEEFQIFYGEDREGCPYKEEEDHSEEDKYYATLA